MPRQITGEGVERDPNEREQVCPSFLPEQFEIQPAKSATHIGQPREQQGVAGFAGFGPLVAGAPPALPLLRGKLNILASPRPSVLVARPRVFRGRGNSAEEERLR